MSVVVAIKKDEKIYVGADSQVTRGGTRRTLNNPNNYKIWKVKGVDNCLMAHVGNVRDSNVVRLIDGLITDYDVYRGNIDYEYVVKSIVPDIVNALKRSGFLKDVLFFRYRFAYHIAADYGKQGERNDTADKSDGFFGVGKDIVEQFSAVYSDKKTYRRHYRLKRAEPRADYRRVTELDGFHGKSLADRHGKSVH